MTGGRIIPLIVTTMFASCSAEVPESSAASERPDASVGNDRGVAETPGDTPVTPAAAPHDTLITPDGWGPLRIDMSRAEVVAAAGEDANPGAVGGPEPDRCDEFRPSNAPDGVLVMIESGVLTRISVSRNTAIATPGGFRIGDPGSSVVAHFGSRARVEPHQYWEPPAKYITIWWNTSPASDRRGIRYEMDANGEIVHIRAGGRSIEYIEGCV